MDNNLSGRIFRLHRNERNITLTELSKQTGIAKSKLSEFENGKRTLSKDMIVQLYSLIGIDYIEDKEALIKVETYVKDMYNHIAKCTSFDVDMHNLKEIKGKIQCTNAYISWKLGEFLYNVYEENSFYDYKKESEILITHQNYLKDYELQVLYDTLGLFYKDVNKRERAIEYFEKGLQINVSTVTTAMINYHRGMILISQGKLHMALSIINKAKKGFDKELCFHRSIMCSVDIGRIYIHLGDYKIAEEIYLNCLEIKEEVSFPKWKKMIIINNLLWNYLLSKDYEKLLSYGKDALELDQNDPDINSYLAYAYWRIEEIDKAKERLKISKRNILKSSKKDQKFIEALNSILLNRSLSIIEKKLLGMYEEALKDFNLQLQQLAFKLLMEMCEKYKDSEKELYYAKKLISVMEERH